MQCMTPQASSAPPRKGGFTWSRASFAASAARASAPAASTSGGGGGEANAEPAEGPAWVSGEHYFGAEAGHGTTPLIRRQAQLHVHPELGAGIEVNFVIGRGYLVESVAEEPGQPSLRAGDLLLAVGGRSLALASEEEADDVLAMEVADGVDLLVEGVPLDEVSPDTEQAEDQADAVGAQPQLAEAAEEQAPAAGGSSCAEAGNMAQSGAPWVGWMPWPWLQGGQAAATADSAPKAAPAAAADAMQTQEQAAASDVRAPPGSGKALSSLSAAELKRRCAEHKLDYSSCLEKAELVALLESHLGGGHFESETVDDERKASHEASSCAASEFRTSEAAAREVKESNENERDVAVLKPGPADVQTADHEPEPAASSDDDEEVLMMQPRKDLAVDDVPPISAPSAAALWLTEHTGGDWQAPCPAKAPAEADTTPPPLTRLQASHAATAGEGPSEAAMAPPGPTAATLGAAPGTSVGGGSSGSRAEANVQEPPTSDGVPPVAAVKCKVEGLYEWLVEMRLEEYYQHASRWCAEMGAVSLEELAENAEDFADEVRLKTIERQRVRKWAMKVLQADPDRLPVPAMPPLAAPVHHQPLPSFQQAADRAAGLERHGGLDLFAWATPHQQPAALRDSRQHQAWTAAWQGMAPEPAVTATRDGPHIVELSEDGSTALLASPEEEMAARQSHHAAGAGAERGRGGAGNTIYTAHSVRLAMDSTGNTGLDLSFDEEWGIVVEAVDPLPGQPGLFPGDLIVAIEGVSLRHRSHEECDQLFGERLDEGVQLSVMRPTSLEESPPHGQQQQRFNARGGPGSRQLWAPMRGMGGMGPPLGGGFPQEWPRRGPGAGGGRLAKRGGYDANRMWTRFRGPPW
eukprot:TRINITY_DN65999_c0_g1_i1.p1 TRINITY_DN65999_c0_g1~~TRINITY_DN65999_c0_g1_i1.p1  ORF type:complete len:862 (-),score=222.27 TRINITY_DN65999_c0_g1_i1:236-2821(-)